MDRAQSDLGQEATVHEPDEELDEAFFDGPRMVQTTFFVEERIVNALRANDVDMGRCVRDALAHAFEKVVTEDEPA